MMKSRDCRGVPGEDAVSMTAHSKSELRMTSDSVLKVNELMREPDSDAPEGAEDGQNE